MKNAATLIISVQTPPNTAGTGIVYLFLYKFDFQY